MTADDLLQDVFLHAHRKLGSFRGDSSLGTWLYRLAVNHCLDFLRGRQAKMTRVTDSLDEEGASEPAAAAPSVPTAVSRIDLERAIARLPDGCRTAFVLHDVEGFEHNEVGAAAWCVGRHVEVAGAQGAHEAARDVVAPRVNAAGGGIA